MSSPLRVEKPEPVAEPAPAPATKRGGGRKIVILSILGILVLAGAVWGFRTIVFYQHHATTDDAQLDGNINPVLPRVSGYVQEVLVSENQPVKPGDILVRIDHADLQAKGDPEEASLLNAEAAVSVAQSAVAGARATVIGSQEKVASNQADVTAARPRAEQTA